MLKRVLKNLRKKPKALRDNVALGIAGTFTVCVFMVWVYHIPDRFQATQDKHQSASDSSFFQLFADMKEGFTSIKEPAVIETEDKPEQLDFSGLMELNSRDNQNNNAGSVLLASSSAQEGVLPTADTTMAATTASPATTTASETRSIRVVTVNNNATTSTTTTTTTTAKNQ